MTKKSNHQQVKNSPKVKEKSSPIRKLMPFVFSLILIVVVFGLYYKTLDYDLTYLDDNDFLKQHQVFLQSQNPVSDIFKYSFGQSFYRPVLSLTLYWNMLHSSVGFSDFHLYNIIFQIVATLLIFLTLYKLQFKVSHSFLFALFYGVHPILTPVVAWIPGRNDSLITIFILLASIAVIYLYDSKNKILQYIYLFLHFLFFAVSLYTKEVAIVLPILLLLYILMIRKEKFNLPINYVLIIGWLALLAKYFIDRQASTGFYATGSSDVAVNSFLSNFSGFFTILGKIFIPYRMSPSAIVEPFSVIIGVAIFAGILTGMLVMKHSNKPIAIFGLIWFTLFLLPTFFALNIDVQYDYLEHRAALPFIGIIVAIYEITTSLSKKIYKFSYILILLIIFGFGYKAYTYSDVYKDRFVFGNTLIENYPFNYTGYYLLGNSYLAVNDYKKADELLSKAYSINSKISYMTLSLSITKQHLGEFNEALEYAKLANNANPDDFPTTRNLGTCYSHIKDYDKAVFYFEKAIKLMKNYDPALVSNLAIIYFQMQNYEKSFPLFESVIEKAPNYPDAYNNLIKCYINTNDLEKARRLATQYRSKGLPVDPALLKQLNLN